MSKRWKMMGEIRKILKLKLVDFSNEEMFNFIPDSLFDFNRNSYGLNFTLVFPEMIKLFHSYAYYWRLRNKPRNVKCHVLYVESEIQ